MCGPCDHGGGMTRIGQERITDMAKLYFRYGTMDSSKTANALMVQYNYMEKKQTAVLLKPQIEDRDGVRKIRSRIGLEAECEFVEEFLRRAEEDWFSGKDDAYRGIDCVIVDEAQFLTAEQVNMFARVVDELDIPVICYGLRTDFTGHLFEGSKRLFELANRLEEVPTVCWCGKKAKFNARVKDGKIVRTGEQIMMGGNESYITLCRRHYFEGRLSAEGGI